MKIMRKYVSPCITEESFVFEGDLAIPFDPNISGGGQLGKMRDDDFADEDCRTNESVSTDDNGWKDGLW